MDLNVPYSLIEDVRESVSRHTRRTPLLRSEWLSNFTGGDVWLKCENLQITGSFKVRGGFAYLARNRPKAVITSSAGNHGQGLALAAKTFSVHCTVVVPKSIPKVKEMAIRSHGAKLVKSPHDGYDDTQAWAVGQMSAVGADFVSPFEDPAVIAGNGGTTALEILDEAPDLDAVVVPCGGGGCINGVAIAMKEKSPGTKVIGVNSDASPGMWKSWQDKKAHLKLDFRETVADGLEGGVGRGTYALSRKFVDDIVLAKEKTIRRAVADIALRERMVVEGSGAAGVAALLDRKIEGKKVCVLLTGSNIDRDLFVRLLGEA